MSGNKHRLRWFAGLLLVLPALAVAEAKVTSDIRAAGPLESDVGWDDRAGRELMNLGPIGVRGYLESDKGLPMQYTGDRIEVRKVFEKSPADGNLKNDDVIIGVNHRQFQPPDCQFQIADAVITAEAANGKLSLQVVRDGAEMNVPIVLPVLGKVGATAPFFCSKTDLLLRNACEWILTQQQPDGGWTLGGGTITADVCGLAMLGSGNPKYLRACKATANWMIDHQYQSRGWTWHTSWNALFLCEYYLATHDRQVLPAIQEIHDVIIEGQVMYSEQFAWASGGWGHGQIGRNPILTKPSVNPPGFGYIELNISALQNMTALSLMKRCGIKVNAERFALGLAYLKKCSDVMPGICYSNWSLVPNPIKGNGTETGFNPAYSSVFAVLLSLDGDEQGPYCRRALQWLSNPLNDRYTPFGHACPEFGMFWTPAAMARLSPQTLIRYNRDMLSYNTLARMYDGSFTHLPSHEELIAKGSCGRQFGRIWSTGWQALGLALGTGRLQFTGGVAGAARSVTGPLKEASLDIEDEHFALATVKLKRLTSAATTRQAEDDQVDNSPAGLARYMLVSIHTKLEEQYKALAKLHDDGDFYRLNAAVEPFTVKFGSTEYDLTIKQWRDELKMPEIRKEIVAGRAYYQLMESLDRITAPAARERSIKIYLATFPASKYAARLEREHAALMEPKK